MDSPSMGGRAADVGGTAGSASGGAPSVGGSMGGVPASGGSTAVTSGAGGVSGGGGTAPDNSGGFPASSGSSAGGASGAGGAGPAEEATFVPDPSWTCGAPDGLVSPTRGKLVFEATLELGETHDLGASQYGARRILDVRSGAVTGEKLRATVLGGGLDLELKLSNGALELEQLNVLRAMDGTLIYWRSCGLAPSGDSTARFVADFEVSNSSGLAWLNTGKFVGTRRLDEAGKKLELAVYDVSTVMVSEPRVRFSDPSGVPNQPWECSTTTGQRGAMVFTETVGIGSSLAVGASKRGTRNIIPITGGTVSGKVAGKVLPGGADFQLVGGTSTLDARYTLEASDGELILIRNCGAFGALIPQFEARAAGPYAFLNANTFLSSDPGSAAGGVSITMYERK